METNQLPVSNYRWLLISASFFIIRRGFATGLVVFGFAAGTAFLNWFIQGLLKSKGLRDQHPIAYACRLGSAPPMRALFSRSMTIP